MLPTVIGREIEQGIKSFLRSTFPSSTPAFEHTLEAFLDEPDKVFKGPYYSLRLPFRYASDGLLPFEKVAFGFPPYLHQARAFQRLCGDTPRSTLVATGTGSGKTECFLYPVLDACALHAGEPGVKAIVIYPMNALATDQARRFAETIYNDPALRGKVTAGLFIGDKGDDFVDMAPDHVITNKGHMLAHPPDILLTNYKMLDILLVRPSTQSLWSENTPTTLRYLVVDELHTFDGAQSTDLACLIRRLKARLHTPAEHLCCVGTSATLGSSGAVAPLLDYARTVFSEPFGDDSVIGEDLLTLNDITDGMFIRFHGVPDAEAPALAPAAAKGNPEAYLSAQYRLWLEKTVPADFMGVESRLKTGELLRQHSLFRNLMLLAERSGRKVLSEQWLLHELGRMDASFSDGAKARRLLDSFLALCAHARYRKAESQKPSPLLRTHVHVWARELSRLVASVERTPRMAFSDDLKGDALKCHLPVVHCRECGAMGWAGVMRANDRRVSPNLQEIYKAFFNQIPTLRFFFPVRPLAGDGPLQREFTFRLCGHCLSINAADRASCESCGAEDKLIEVIIHDRSRRKNEQTEADVSCPYCDSASGMMIVGSRSASLTSVALGQIYASPFNDEKQALAFSDNVQDASHRSGFFAGRTYRVNLRTALRKVVSEAETELTVAALETRFLDYWKEALGDLDFTGIFLPPNMEWLEDYETLKETGALPPGSNLLSLVSRRTSWEIASEFGFNCRIGRTLEKSGAAVAHPDRKAVEETATRLRARLAEKVGGLTAVTERELAGLLLGLLHRLRTGGGIYHPELDAYVSSGGNTFLLNRQNHMPSFGNYVRAPAYFYQGTKRCQRFEKLVAGGTTQSWSQRWVVKSLTSVKGGVSQDTAALVVEEAVQALTDNGLLSERKTDDLRIWGLPPESLFVSKDVSVMTCRACGHSISCAPDEVALWEKAPCLRSTCAGTYALQPPVDDYFGDLYKSGDVVRIRTAEHTGLLERKVREWTEQRFMARGKDRRSTDPNLLSCTPTLEMGVNIGDLSTVVLCTVPPATSNYVQRVGRAGRKDGVAVSLTIGSAQPHDLYYFELPEDMITGEILPPGIFLNAPAVIERQFTAYCFDRWSEQVNPQPVLPNLIDPILDVVINDGEKRGFPFDFFGFVSKNIAVMLSGFFRLFSDKDLPPSSRTALERFARGDGKEQGDLTHKILLRLRTLAEERKDLKIRMQKIGTAIRKNRDISARDEALDAELEDLKQYRDSVHEMIKQINSKVTLNFLTDEGLLPNFAFPEEGVELRGVILKKKAAAKDDDSKYRKFTLEYMRPAASAITELAPGNVFYVEGRKLKIDQIGLSVSPVELWHFCDACGYMELITDSASKRTDCPSCGSPNWTDSSLKRELVRLRQVVSTSFDDSSRSHDEEDTRQHQFYSRQESVVIPADAERRAYQICGSSVPFGFEFLAKTTFRVVNLGHDSDAAQAFRLGGREVSTGGFVLCKKCGKVQTLAAGRGEEEMKHDIACPHRNKADSAPLKAVFLYRELTSEAIRVLLPSTESTEESDLTSFVAALHLGLRLHFKGNIEHLRGCVDERPVQGTSMRRKYLVLYDQVPGGTGYLKQLSQPPSVFLDVLRKALNHLNQCVCATRDDHETDGCHRCILMSRSHGNQTGLSRTSAIRLLTAILENADQLEEVEKITDIDIHPLLQSALEKAFLESLRQVPGAQLQAKIVRNKPGWVWRRDDAVWEIEPQAHVESGPEVSVPSIPDFMLYPVRPEASRPIAVFLDGFAFHAEESSGHNRIHLDVKQRQALLDSGKYWVWNFSWEDIQYRNEPAKITLTPWGEDHAALRNERLAPMIFTGEELSLARVAGEYSSWSLFLEYLAHPAAGFWRGLAYLYGLALPPQLQPVNREQAVDALGKFARFSGPIPPLPAAPLPVDGLGGVYTNGQAQLAAVAVASLKGIQNRDVNDLFLVLRFDDDAPSRETDFAAHWRGFLRLQNRVQFLPALHVVTARGVQLGVFAGIEDAYSYYLAGGGDHVGATTSDGASRDTPDFDLSLAHPAIRPLLKALLKEKCPPPALGHEWMENGMIVATAEAVWEEANIAILDSAAADDQQAFVKAGWSVVTFTSEGVEPHVLDDLLAKLRLHK